MHKELCKVAVRGIGQPDLPHVYTPGRGWPVGSDTIVTVIDAEEDPPAPAELTANAHGEVRHPTMIGKATLQLLEKHHHLSVKVVDGIAPVPPPVDVLAGANARADIAEAEVKRITSILAAAEQTNADHVKAREGMGEKIQRLEAQLNARGAPQGPRK